MIHKGNSICVETDEYYPSLRRNNKNGRKIRKTRDETKRVKIRAFNAETKAALKLQRRITDKMIDKNRHLKRRLKNMESGIRTPMEELWAYHEAESVSNEIEMEKYEKKREKRWVELAEDYGFKLAYKMLIDGEFLVDNEFW